MKVQEFRGSDRRFINLEFFQTGWKVSSHDDIMVMRINVRDNIRELIDFV
jgi:hypothetical protein